MKHFPNPLILGLSTWLRRSIYAKARGWPQTRSHLQLALPQDRGEGIVMLIRKRDLSRPVTHRVDHGLGHRNFLGRGCFAVIVYGGFGVLGGGQPRVGVIG